MPTPARIPVIAGPTAGGKSALALAMARRLGGPGAAEIVSADAFQVYRGMDIGTAKASPDEREGIVHHAIDVADPRDRFTVADWLALARRGVDEIRARGRTPIVVGGTHLYIKAFLDGLMEAPPGDDAARQALRARDPASLRAELERVDPAAAARIHANDLRRTIRALEVFHATGVPISSRQTQWDHRSPDAPGADSILVILHWPKELLNPRINARVRDMIARGLADEARALWARGDLGGRNEDEPLTQAGEALGYKQLVAHFWGRCTLDEAVERIKVETRRFAKNQRTWLNRLRAYSPSIVIDASVTPAEAWPDAAASALEGMA